MDKRKTEYCFWTKVLVGGEDECWEWRSFRNEDGYGRTRFRGRMALTHRIAWLLTHGFLDDDVDVLHSCDNRPCCNPKHLFLGTNADNVADRCRKGRSARTMGESHGCAKLNRAAVAAIRAAYRKGRVTHQQLADDYGVAKGTVGFILRGETWVEQEARP